MTGREWKPGDVGDINGARAMRALGVRWQWIDGSISRDAETASGARPLVVIDPEDREQVERLAAAYQKAVRGDLPAAPNEGWMQTALRSLVTPPKPDEPTGLGAVVEDAEGELWVRCDETENNIGRPWHGPDQSARPYAKIAAVRVLSEGVQA